MNDPRIAFVERTKNEITGIGGRVFPSPLPQSAKLPAITYSVFADERNIRVSDIGEDRFSRFQVNILAYSESELSTMESELSRVWGDYSGDIPPVRLLRVKIGDSRDVPGVREPGSDTIVRQRSIDLTIKYKVIE